MQAGNRSRQWQGSGRGIALALAREGADGSSCRRTEDTMWGGREIEKPAGQRWPMVADVTRTADIQRLVADTVRGLGGIDILVNNDADPGPRSTVDVTDEAFAASAGECGRGRLPADAGCRPHWARAVDHQTGQLSAVNPLPAGRGVTRGQAATKDPGPGGCAELGAGRPSG